MKKFIVFKNLISRLSQVRTTSWRYVLHTFRYTDIHSDYGDECNTAASTYSIIMKSRVAYLLYKILPFFYVEDGAAEW